VEVSAKTGPATKKISMQKTEDIQS